MKILVSTLLTVLLLTTQATAQTAAPPRAYDMRLTQEDFNDIYNLVKWRFTCETTPVVAGCADLASRTSYEEITNMVSRLQLQLNAIGAADKAAAEKAASEAKAKAEAEMRAKIEKEKSASPEAPK
jgi:hypothetical protein